MSKPMQPQSRAEIKAVVENLGNYFRRSRIEKSHFYLVILVPVPVLGSIDSDLDVWKFDCE